ncbi:four-carbon acid sugar kinase family protein [Microbacterium sp. DT81.1]|uniref:four-carbon acid sugar kinase family protein n=1 Tax=Microbacterium sp. DT81.1 TaxID=3393413 RepID=UPI003CE9649A
MPRTDELLLNYPDASPVSAEEVERGFQDSGRVLVVLDDDPTGTQSVANLPVLTRWNVEDFRWAFGIRLGGRPASAVYVLTNTRSLDPDEAAERNRQVVTAALIAASETRLAVGFVSRSDSTLRGHYPLEPSVIAETVAAQGGDGIDGVVIVPAFPEAGRVTIGSEHYLLEAPTLTRVADTEFARDATFGFSTSYLPAYIEEKSAGRVRAHDVIVLDLAVIRSDAATIAAALEPARDAVPIVVDIVTENDLRSLALGLEEAERRGKTLLYRVGPPFVRARIGQTPRMPLTADEVYGGHSERAGSAVETGGLIVVGSHVGLTTRQLSRLTAVHRRARIVELDVQQLLDADSASDYVARAVDTVVEALRQADVILHTSRLLVRSDDAAESLRISRAVSAGVVSVVNRTLHIFPPRFVIAKGGITSSDVAANGLEIRRAMVRGPMLPGIVSLWEALEGPATGIPYVVFAGNVGDEESLLAVTRKLSSYLSDDG